MIGAKPNLMAQQRAATATAPGKSGTAKTSTSANATPAKSGKK
jgi:hypothetical protein